MALEEFKKDIYTCVKCGACRSWYDKIGKDSCLGTPVCPSGEKFGFDSYFCKGRLDIAKGLIEGTLEWTERLLPRIYNCTLCGACDYQCYQAVMNRPLGVLKELRRELIRKGIGPLSTQGKSIQNLLKDKNPYGRPSSKRMEWIKEYSDIRANKALFVGCTASYLKREIVMAMIKILGKAHISFQILEDEWCCGSLLSSIGMDDLAKDFAHHNILALMKSGVEEVIFACPSCYNAFKNHYQQENDDLPFKLFHISEYIAQLIRREDIELIHDIPIKVTYHDPCSLGRHSSIYQTPRDILSRIPQLQLAEMKRNREKAWCCGAGGGVKIGNPSFSLWTAGERLKEAEATGADSLVTSCPDCNNNLSMASKHMGINMKIYDLTELTAISMGG